MKSTKTRSCLLPSARPETAVEPPVRSNSGIFAAAYITREELARDLHRDPRTLARWEKQGWGPPVTCVGKMRVYRRAAVETWLRNLEQQPGTRRSSRGLRLPMKRARATQHEQQAAGR